MRTFANAILFVVMATLSLSLNAQNKYTLTGQIFDSITAQPIANPNVSIAGTNYKTIGSEKGYYKIDKLIPGTNNLLVWAEGYDTAIVHFEIRNHMKLNVKLMQVLDTASLHIEENMPDSVAADTLPQEIPAPKVKKEKKKKIVKTELTEKEREEIKILIEDVIFSKSIYFERFKNKRTYLCVWGSFSIDTGYLYTFEAKFSKKNGFVLQWLDFKMKGKHAQ